MPSFQDDPVISRNHLGHADFDGGVYGESNKFNALRGITRAPGHGAVVGVSEVPIADDPAQNAGPGVFGQSNAAGVWGESKTWHGVFGHTESTTGGHGVSGEGPVGVAGVGHTWIGVYGETRADRSAGASGVLGEGKDGGVGVKGHASGQGIPGVAGYNLANTGPGVFGQGSPAGLFQGDVVVTGDLILEGADYAEAMTVGDTTVAAGMVVVLDDDGRIQPCVTEYDERVAGIVAGGGGVRSAVVLDRHEGGAPLALMGKAWALAEAGEDPIRPGDLLTSSAILGHARRASDRTRSFGAVIGRALTPLASGRALVRVLVGGV